MKYSIKTRQDLGDAIQALRVTQEATQAELSQFSQIARQTLSEIEHSRVDVQLSTVIRLLKFLGAELQIVSKDESMRIR